MIFVANLSINCVDGATEGIISHDPARLLGFLKDRDHEGSSISMIVRPDPEQFIEYYNEEVVRFLEDEIKNG
jgi:hypothetical protein